MPCFAVGVNQATSTLRQRFQLHLSAEEAEHFVETDLIAKSFGSYYTRLYVCTCPLPLPLLEQGLIILLAMILFNIARKVYIKMRTNFFCRAIQSQKTYELQKTTETCEELFGLHTREGHKSGVVD